MTAEAVKGSDDVASSLFIIVFLKHIRGQILAHS